MSKKGKSSRGILKVIPKEVKRLMLCVSFLFLLLILNAAPTLGQSKEKTETWIDQVISNYAFSSAEVTNRYDPTFTEYEGSDCYMIINGYNAIRKLNAQTAYQYGIVVSQLSGVQLVERNINVKMILKIKPKPGNYIWVSWPEYTEKKQEVGILLSNSIKQNNLIQRLTKAFNHYIGLCGGEPLDDTF